MPKLPERADVTKLFRGAVPHPGGRVSAQHDGGDGPLVLELDLSVPVLTEPPANLPSALRSRTRPRLAGILSGLRRAAVDPDVAAVIVHIGGAPLGLAHAQEISAAIAEFRAASPEKPVVAWAETYGEFGPGNSGFLLAAGCEQVWVQESGDIGLTGSAAEATFLTEALDRVGVRVQLHQRHEYKNAANTFTETELTPAHAEALQRLVDGSTEQLVDAVARGRGLATNVVRELVNRAPLAPEEALAAGLVDRIGYRDEVYDAVRERVGGQLRLRFLSRYGHSPRTVVRDRIAGRNAARHGRVALVYGSGAIHLGRSRPGPTGNPTIGSTTVSAALRSATTDPDVAAIVFRVDSPGGSYTASDTVRREVVRARQAGKPVIVSMGSVAGSGGYFISMAATTIFAQPGTLTGSIGVFGGKGVVAGLLDRVGIGTGAVTAGEQALMFSSRTPYTDAELAVLDRWLDRVYDDFTHKVAVDRGITPERAHELARGRVWLGSDALDRGLIDALGGLAGAVVEARRQGGLAPRDDDADVVVYPRLRLTDRVRPARSSEDPAAAAAAMVSGWGSLGQLAGTLGLPSAGPLVVPPWALRAVAR